MRDESLRRRPPSDDDDPPRTPPTRELAELKATALLARARITKPPVDVELCAREAGIALVVTSDLGIGDADGSSAVLMQRGEVLIALINERHAPVRRRFSLAHEIGHWLLERVPGTKELAPIAARGRTYDRVERVCNYFAASLLMPRAWVRDRVNIGMTTGELARAFDVSAPAMAARMRELGLATQRGRL